MFHVPTLTLARSLVPSARTPSRRRRARRARPVSSLGDKGMSEGGGREEEVSRLDLCSLQNAECRMNVVARGDLSLPAARARPRPSIRSSIIDRAFEI